MTSDVGVLAYDIYINGVGEVGVKGIWNLAIGDHFLDLIDFWIGRRHDEKLMMEVDLDEGSDNPQMRAG